MTEAPKCDRCSAERIGFGAVWFSPPDKLGYPKKYHVCDDCYQTLVDLLERKETQ